MGAICTSFIVSTSHYGLALDYSHVLVCKTYRLELSDHVTFLKSPSDKTKIVLLHKCRSLIYTPSEEHFGIVPIEAMYCGRPVIAVNNGGPAETVLPGESGFLVESGAEDFAFAMKELFLHPSKAEKMGQAGRKIVESRFSFEKFTNQLTAICENL